MSSQTFSDAPAGRAARPSHAWRTRRLELGAFGVAVFEAGRSDAEAPVLVFVHGMGHWTQAAWDAVAADFEATHRIVAFDLPGFGESDKPDVRYTLAFFTGVLKRVVDDCGLTQFALAGHSLGGLIAADFAARYPACLRALILIDPAGFLRTPTLALRIFGSRPVTKLMGAIKPTRGFVKRTLLNAVFDPASIREEQIDRGFALASDPSVRRAFFGVYAGALHEMIHMTDLHARLAAWRGPTLIVWGRQDHFVPIRALATARTVYPQADVLEIDRCGHCPNIEYPSLVAARMRAAGA